MLEQIVEALPEPWRGVFGALLAPLVWIPPMQRAVAQFLVEPSSLWSVAAKYVLVLLPAVLGLVALWCTQCALYTLPFRSQRRAFVATMLLMWWDAVRASWLYWVGVVRVALVLGGWSAMFVGLALVLLARGVAWVARLPARLGERIAARYARPGVPWIAVIMFRFWCFLEATVLTWALYPRVSKKVASFVGTDRELTFTAPILYVFVLLLLIGSFSSLERVADAIRRRELKWTARLVVLGLSVMTFEVAVLYRQLARALAPVIARQLGWRAELGLWLTLAVPLIGWIGVRSMTWLLFGHWGAPVPGFLLSRPSPVPSRPSAAGAAALGTWRAELDELGRGMGWLHERSDELVEHLALPVLTVLAAALNFGMVLVTSRPVFSLPFKGLRTIADTGQILAAVGPPPLGPPAGPVVTTAQSLRPAETSRTCASSISRPT